MSFSNSDFGESLQIDGLTLQQTPIGIAVIPNNLPVNYTLTTNNTTQNVVISVNSTLTGDIICNNFTIDSGITLITNGYNIYCNGNFTNNGTINTSIRSVSQNFSNSYGGSGGGEASGYSGGGANGFNTSVSGGAGAVGFGNGATANNGTTATAPTITNSLLQSMYENGMANYLCGGAGGNSNNGAYGIYIQAVNIVAGTINTNGGNGGSGGISGAGAPNVFGGGGGGTIILSYQTSLTAGTYNVGGGARASIQYNGGEILTSGGGGSGLSLTYNYTTAPILATGVSITSTQSTLFTNTITLSAIFNIKTTVILQINGSSSQPAVLYFYIDNNLIQTITAFNGSTTILSAQQLSIGTHTFSVQGILTSGTTSCSADLSAFLIEQIIGNGG